MVLDELHSGIKVRLIEFIRDVPPQRTKLAPLLDSGVQESHGIQHGLPLGPGAHIQQVLAHTCGIKLGQKARLQLSNIFTFYYFYRSLIIFINSCNSTSLILNYFVTYYENYYLTLGCPESISP